MKNVLRWVFLIPVFILYVIFGGGLTHFLLVSLHDYFFPLEDILDYLLMAFVFPLFTFIVFFYYGGQFFIIQMLAPKQMLGAKILLGFSIIIYGVQYLTNFSNISGLIIFLDIITIFVLVNLSFVNFEDSEQ